MASVKQKTVQTTCEQAQNDRAWHIVDVSDIHIGRAATQIAHLLRGKHKPTFTPHVDCGDFVVVINANKVKLSGKKAAEKLYHKHSLFPGGLKTRAAKEMLQERADQMIEQAVFGMLPKGPLGRVIRKKLKVYTGTEHPHTAQQPKEYKLLSMRNDA